MKEKIYTLTFEEITALVKNFEVLTFNNNFDLVYEKQVPSAGIAIIEGEVELIKNSKPIETIQPGHLLGVMQLLNHKSVKFGCRMKSNTKVVLLGKMDLLLLIKDRKSIIAKTIRELAPFVD